MDQISLFFKCQSCQQYVLTTNIQCPNGHQVCQACSENLSDCPTCHQRVAPSTRIPFLLTSGVEPILGVSESFDLLLPTLLRLAPALHPCDADEMIFAGQGASDARSTDLLQKNDSGMQRNNSIADQLLMADNSCEVEETLSRLMLLASMSSPRLQNTSTPNSISPFGINGSVQPDSTTSPPLLLSQPSSATTPISAVTSTPNASPTTTTKFSPSTTTTTLLNYHSSTSLED